MQDEAEGPAVRKLVVGQSKPTRRRCTGGGGEGKEADRKPESALSASPPTPSRYSLAPPSPSGPALARRYRTTRTSRATLTVRRSCDGCGCRRQQEARPSSSSPSSSPHPAPSSSTARPCSRTLNVPRARSLALALVPETAKPRLGPADRTELDGEEMRRVLRMPLLVVVVGKAVKQATARRTPSSATISSARRRPWSPVPETDCAARASSGFDG